MDPDFQGVHRIPPTPRLLSWSSSVRRAREHKTNLGLWSAALIIDLGSVLMTGAHRTLRKRRSHVSNYFVATRIAEVVARPGFLLEGSNISMHTSSSQPGSLPSPPNYPTWLAQGAIGCLGRQHCGRSSKPFWGADSHDNHPRHTRPAPRTIAQRATLPARPALSLVMAALPCHHPRAALSLVQTASHRRRPVAPKLGSAVVKTPQVWRQPSS